MQWTNIVPNTPAIPPKPLYHANREELQPGDIVAPGNYGRLLLGFGPAHFSWDREQLLELVRRQHFPDKPSRLESTYACIDLDIARRYRAHHCPEGYLYEVEVSDPSQPWHLGDFNAVELIPGKNWTPFEAAARYWQYKDHVRIKEWEDKYCDEFLTASPFRVVALVPLASTVP